MDSSDYIFGMINFYEATFLCGLSKMQPPGAQIQEIFIFVISGLDKLFDNIN